MAGRRCHISTAACWAAALETGCRAPWRGRLHGRTATAELRRAASSSVCASVWLVLARRCNVVMLFAKALEENADNFLVPWAIRHEADTNEFYLLRVLHHRFFNLHFLAATARCV